MRILGICADYNSKGPGNRVEGSGPNLLFKASEVAVQLLPLGSGANREGSSRKLWRYRSTMGIKRKIRRIPQRLSYEFGYRIQALLI